MKDLTKLKELVLEKVSLADVLKSYDVDFMYSPDLADEVQFRCPIHGRDNKPSARYYRETQTCYCWVCQKKWDVISFVRDKEELNFIGAILHLISKYKIDTSSIPDTPDFRPLKPKTADQEKIQEMQEEAMSISLKGKIREFKNKIPLERYAALCTAFNMVMFDKSKGMGCFKNLKKLELKLQGIKNEQ
jgi:hypothetical protein